MHDQNFCIIALSWFLKGLEEGITILCSHQQWDFFYYYYISYSGIFGFGSVKASERSPSWRFHHFLTWFQSKRNEAEKDQMSERYVQWILFFQTDKRSLRVIFFPFERWIKRRTFAFFKHVFNDLPICNKIFTWTLHQWNFRSNIFLMIFTYELIKFILNRQF